MPILSRAGLVAATLIVGSATVARGQNSSDDRLQKVEQRLDALEREHRRELAERDAEIARLKALAGTATTRPATAGGLIDEIDQIGGPAPGDPSSVTARHIEDDAARRSAAPFSLGRTPASFNPDIAVISDFLGSYSSNRGNNAYNRFDVREVELDIRAAVHPNADGVAILAFERDVENPVFPGAEAAEGPEGGVSIEEAYLFLHDFGVPNLTAKLGRYHLRFGRQNVLHLHDLPTSDPPLINQAFLAPEALTDSGLSLSYVLPPRLVRGQYIELVGEVLANEGGSSSESPTLRGDVSADAPAFNTHLLWNTDLSRAWNLEVGGSFLHGTAGEENEQDVNLYGADLTLIHADPTGGFFNQLFQAEAIYGDTYSDEGEQQHAFGAYFLGQQQLSRDWYAGVRLDYTQNPNADDQEAWAVSPYVSFYWSEFLRFRVQYQHKDGDVESEDDVFFQATWIFGAHPPHPYWSMR